MAAPRLIVLEQRVHALERVEKVGEILGLSRATAYRQAQADEWPMTGPRTSRFVVVPALLERLGIAYTVEQEDERAAGTSAGE